MKNVKAVLTAKVQKGTATIEFAMGFIFFWLMCAFWVEIAFLSYVSGLGDMAIAQASLHSKRLASTTEFLGDFEEMLSKEDSVWASVIDVTQFRFSVRYLTSFTELSAVTEKCAPDEESEDISIECGTATGSSIAIYRVDYMAPHIFSYFFDTESMFTREAIVIQEYQRDEFSID